MKNHLISRQFHNLPLGILVLAVLLTILWVGIAIRPANAARPATIIHGTIATNTTWTEANSPYQIDNFIAISPGVILTIEAGVEVNGINITGPNYNFEVDGTLLALGTSAKPILIHNTIGLWSGIEIFGTVSNINTGSDLEYVTLDGGGLAGSGVGGNLVLQYSQVDVHHSQFINSPGDGILGDDASAGGVANIYDSSFTNNAGFAIDFENGSVNPILHNLTASGNGASLGYGGNLVYINDATLTGNHIWENMGLPYLILGTIVGPSSQLTIEPGVQVLSLPGNDNLDVQGSLLADGTASQVIHFDPLTPTLGWSGIAIMGTDIFPSAGGLLNQVIITKGGFGGNCDLYVQYGNATVTNSQLDSSEDSGLCLGQRSTLVMTDTQLTNNQKYAMDIIDAGDIFYLDNLTATGNLSNTIGVEGGNITDIHTWPKSGINTYDLFYGAVTVDPTGTLNIDPGVTVLFGFTRDLTVKGILNAIGTPAEPILFSGETPDPGLWTGINFVGTPEQHAIGRLAYDTIEYGGYGGAAMIYIENADVTFRNCILRYCSNDAIYIQPSKALGRQPAASQAVPVTQIVWSSLLNIGGYAVNNPGSQPVFALYNWWNAASGPTANDNPDGTGSAINGLVLYRPYITGPDASFIYLTLLKKP